MTTTVKIEAHCSNEKEVEVYVFDAEDKLTEKFILQDGEKAERFVYDDRMISVRERLIEHLSI